MNSRLIATIERQNPWFKEPNSPIHQAADYIERAQTERLLQADWDNLWLILTGPRQAGKTRLGKYLCARLIDSGRFDNLLYLNCDQVEIREWLQNSSHVLKALDYWTLQKPIVFIDEVQRLENPGLLLKALIDLNRPIKFIASGSSQLEIKSRVQEFLTGRQLESLVLPLSFVEDKKLNWQDRVMFGGYPQIVLAFEKEILLQQLYQNYINKDIIEILKIGKPDVAEKLLALIAHASGQLINYSTLATDCRVNVSTIQHYLDLFEKTYVVQAIKPFVGNKRTEITANPIYYFIDNGFRNQALDNFVPLERRTDAGLLIQSVVFQELQKINAQNFSKFKIYFWRTKGGAKVDFILKKGEETIPIEVKFKSFKQPKIDRGFRSFLEAYKPKIGIYITQDYFDKIKIENCTLHFIPIEKLAMLQELISVFL